MSCFTELNFDNSTCDAPVHILDDVLALQDEIVRNRRWFHEHPELSFEEKTTSAKVASILRSYGLEEVWENVGKTGVVGMIRGNQSGPCIALRADMVCPCENCVVGFRHRYA